MHILCVSIYLPGCNYTYTAVNDQVPTYNTLYTAVTNEVPTYGTAILESGSGGHGHLFIQGTNGYSPVCDHTFGMREGDVACRQMGYNRAISVVKNS